MSGALGTGSFNGLSWGPATKIHISQIAGVDDLPPISNSDEEASYSDGAYAGHDRAPARRITAEYTLIGDTAADYDSLVESLKSAMTRVNADLPLKLFGSTRQFNVRPQRRVVPYDAGYRRKTGSAAVEFVAVDPRMYDVTVTTLTTGLAGVSGGMTFNATFPVSFGAVGGGGTVVATNAGTYQTPLTFTIAGPVVNPIIDNQTTGQSLLFTITLVTGDTLVISGAGTSACAIVLNGTASRRNALAVGSAPLSQFGLPGGEPGPCAANTSQTFRFRNNGSFSSGTLQISFQSSWI
jgi:hypothetical protein